MGIAMILTMVMTYFFPQQVLGTSEGLSYAFFSVPALVSILIVSVTPAICEEAVFRGVVFNSFWPIGNKWIVIVLTGCIFGHFTGVFGVFCRQRFLGWRWHIC